MPPVLWLLLGVLLPLVVAVLLVRPCGAPTEEGHACRNPKPGPFRRCHLHEGDSSTRDWMFIVLVLLAAVVAVLVWVTHPGLTLEEWIRLG